MEEKEKREERGGKERQEMDGWCGLHVVCTFHSVHDVETWKMLEVIRQETGASR